MAQFDKPLIDPDRLAILQVRDLRTGRWVTVAKGSHEEMSKKSEAYLEVKLSIDVRVRWAK